ncbi:restriction endonuclease [Candidatus Woesebacteria bacterium]|nr:restriction endonuclease [Candidatus Woesebacteria bacterium]|tara:strand:+ start:2034 stop:2633 length:600 start_codon:yes stop_codon:yes gene_type:complete
MGRYQRRRRTAFDTWQILGVLLVIILGLLVVAFVGGIDFKILDFFTQSFVWIVAPFIILVSAFLVYLYIRDRRLVRALRISDVDGMAGIEFEKYVAEILRQKGYKVILTPPSNDFGVDLVVDKDGIKHAVQLKRYSVKVDRKAISDAVAGLQYYKCSRAVVVTNSLFTEAAKEFAQANDCILIDRNKLSEWIYNFQQGK